MFGNGFRNAPNERSLTYCFSYGLVHICLKNKQIPCVWQWFSQSAKRAFINLWFFSKSVGIICIVNMWIPYVLQWISIAPRYRLLMYYFPLRLVNIFWITYEFQVFGNDSRKAKNDSLFIYCFFLYDLVNICIINVNSLCLVMNRVTRPALV